MSGTLEAVRERRLTNGLRLIALPSEDGLAHLCVAAAFGAADDPDKGRGLAHLAEHMLCGHWRHLRPVMGAALRAAFDAGAVRFDAETALDHLVFRASFPAELAAEFLALDAVRWNGELLHQEALDLNKAALLHELARLAPSRPTAILYRRLYALAFPGHPYGSYTFGEPSGIAGLGLASVRAVFGRIPPARRAAAFAAPIEPERGLALLEAAYGGLPARASQPAEAPRPLAPSKAADELVELPELPAPALLAALPTPPLFSDGKAAAALNALNELVVRTLRAESGGRHGFLPAMREAGMWELLSLGGAASSEALRDDIVGALHGLPAAFEEPEPVDSLLKAMPRLLKSGWTPPVLAEQLCVRELLGGGWRGLLNLETETAALTRASLRDAAERYALPEKIIMARADGQRPGRREVSG